MEYEIKPQGVISEMTKKIGIIGAMDIEVDGLVKQMTHVKKEKYGIYTYYDGILFGKGVVVVKCGIGKVNSSMCAQIMIYKYRPDVIINSGVAGAIDDKLNILDCVVATKVVQHDLDTTPIGDPLGYISGLDTIYLDTSEDISKKMYEAVKKTGNNVVMGIIASGDQFIAGKEKKEFLLKQFGAIACEMEGGAIGHICVANRVPFAVIRTISDGKGDALDFITFSKIAADKSVDIIKEFIKNYEV